MRRRETRPENIIQIPDLAFQLRFDLDNHEETIKWFIRNFFPGQEIVCDPEKPEN
jgi:hypothetical protein